MIKTFILLLGCLWMGAAFGADSSISKEEIPTLRTWNTEDSELFDKLFVGLHEGALDLSKLSAAQVQRVGSWQNSSPTLFLRMFSMAWPDSTRRTAPPMVKRSTPDDRPKISI